jgi:polyisoprenoid-binding protein YceI
MEATATKTKWGIDITHSEVQFKVKHLIISTVTGSFKTFDGSLETENDNFDGGAVTLDVDVNSIDTNQVDRDNHLRSADFFNVEEFPKMTFNGSLQKKEDARFELSGSLTIKGTTKELTLAVEYGGTMVDGYGQTKAGFEVEGKINRKDFGLTWSMVTEAGGVVVGDDIKLLFNVQFTKA